MEKLVFKNYCTDECTYGYDNYYPFEYSSKDDFIFFVLEEIDKCKERNIKEYGKKDGSIYYLNNYITIFDDITIKVDSLIDYIKQNIYTLDEWFELNKCKTI